MGNLKIVITQPIPEVGLDLLRSYGEPTIGPPEAKYTESRLCDFVRGADAVVCFVGDSITQSVLQAAAPTCKIVANYGVGTDNIDIESATRLGIRVTNTPGVLTAATADLTMASMLSLMRGLRGAEALAHSGKWSGIAPMQIFGCDLSGKTLGIVGAGRIGCAVAMRAVGFEMKLVYASRRERETMAQLGGRRTPLETLFEQSDVVSLHVPLTPETKHLVAKPLLTKMKSSAYLVNTSRGAVVCESDLIDCLSSGGIAGAALDVFEFEPQIPQPLLDMPNVVCLPHMGSATHETRGQKARIAAENNIACLEGRELPNPVN